MGCPKGRSGRGSRASVRAASVFATVLVFAIVGEAQTALTLGQVEQGLDTPYRDRD
jgi:hypothetical protein